MPNLRSTSKHREYRDSVVTTDLAAHSANGGDSALHPTEGTMSSHDLRTVLSGHRSGHEARPQRALTESCANTLMQVNGFHPVELPTGMEMLDVSKPRLRRAVAGPDHAQHVIAQMQRDQRMHIAAEARYRQKEPELPKDRQSGKPAIVKKRKSRAIAPPRLSSLAATHPSLYTPPTKPCQTFQVQSKDAQTASTVVHNPDSTHVGKTSAPPWRVYSDPTYMTSTTANLNDPMFRMLKSDVQTQPNVISPLFLIGLPLGTLIEAAHQYADSRDQPSDGLV